MLPLALLLLPAPAGADDWNCREKYLDSTCMEDGSFDAATCTANECVGDYVCSSLGGCFFESNDANCDASTTPTICSDGTWVLPWFCWIGLTLYVTAKYFWKPGYTGLFTWLFMIGAPGITMLILCPAMGSDVALFVMSGVFVVYPMVTVPVIRGCVDPSGPEREIPPVRLWWSTLTAFLFKRLDEEEGSSGSGSAAAKAAATPAPAVTPGDMPMAIAVPSVVSPSDVQPAVHHQQPVAGSAAAQVAAAASKAAAGIDVSADLD